MRLTVAATLALGHSSAAMQARNGKLEPLTETELEELADNLELHGPLDIDGVLGLLHAVVVAPSVIPPIAWLPLVLPDTPDQEGAEELIAPLLRLHNDVHDALHAQEGILPDPDDESGCESFAAGYTAGAELDPLWREDANHWTFAAPIAFLGGRPDLVPANVLAKLEAMPEPKSELCHKMGSIIAATHSTFRKARQATLAEVTNRDPSRSARVGRNAPCPCGSGMKYKRCCINHPQAPAEPGS